MRKVLYIIFNLHIRQSRRSILMVITTIRSLGLGIRSHLSVIRSLDLHNAIIPFKGNGEFQKSKNCYITRPLGL